MVSVIIPAYNPGKYIMDAFSSAVIQDVKKEIIIVDDHSGEAWIDDFLSKVKWKYDVSEEKTSIGGLNEKAIAFKWAGIVCDKSLKNRKFPVYIFSNKENKKVAATRNRGVKLARGKYVAFLDADDIWEEKKLEKQLEAMKQYKAAPLCNTSRMLVDSEGDMLDKIITTPIKITLKDIEKTNCINCSSVLIKRDVMLKYPMQHSDAHEDYLSWLKILKDYEYAVGIQEPLLLYRMTPGSKSGNKLKSAVMNFKTYRYAGYGFWKSVWCNLCYAINGIIKYSR